MVRVGHLSTSQAVGYLGPSDLICSEIQLLTGGPRRAPVKRTFLVALCLQAMGSLCYIAVSCYVVICYALLCYASLCYASLCFAVLRSVGGFPSLPVTGDPFGVTCHRLRFVLHCCVLLRGAMLCFAMLGYLPTLYRGVSLFSELSNRG